MPNKFCSEAYFFRLEVLWRAWYLRLGTQGLKSIPEDLRSRFLRLEKIHRPQPGLNSRTLDPETDIIITIIIIIIIIIIINIIG